MAKVTNGVNNRANIKYTKLRVFESSIRGFASRDAESERRYKCFINSDWLRLVRIKRQMCQPEVIPLKLFDKSVPQQSLRSTT